MACISFEELLVGSDVGLAILSVLSKRGSCNNLAVFLGCDSVEFLMWVFFVFSTATLHTRLHEEHQWNVNQNDDDKNFRDGYLARNEGLSNIELVHTWISACEEVVDHDSDD